jgi:hypothetical protein
MILLRDITNIARQLEIVIPWHSLKIAELALNNYFSFTKYLSDEM